MQCARDYKLSTKKEHVFFSLIITGEKRSVYGAECFDYKTKRKLPSEIPPSKIQRVALNVTIDFFLLFRFKKKASPFLNLHLTSAGGSTQDVSGHSIGSSDDGPITVRRVGTAGHQVHSA